MGTLAESLVSSERIVFLTGAGVSASSGIPDYRSKNGLYMGKENPEYLLSATCLQNEPDKFYAFVRDNMYYPNAEPNVIHKKMAEIERRAGKKVTVVTQNIDGLHAKAGSRNVVEFHGSLYRCTCQRCGMMLHVERYLESDKHEDCGGTIRPDVVLYEENLPEDAINRALEAITKADLIVIVGTSFKVSPFCNLTDYRKAESVVFAVNQELLRLPLKYTMIQDNAISIFKEL
ncbi:NAD-dependent protein deacylase [Paenilisteria rocourtiae]|uniref:protein acetyllysine N-acetyltransferase n=1 Tax=Listeria rocourtiae TaxID=647910 RepID=A0A4R6ZLH8_9LIST|nr:NAD-dependent protein deacylase [Listeria rocourtiae]EUJ47561.1 NAD-dependent deacetylase [Listeria rocourtiae FSL F6-920]TDR53122.1 NAD-dependent deacetylase [Listeria rocourtiae]